MASAPVTKLKKTEIVWLGSHKCKHAHTYLEHYSCFLYDFPEGNPLDIRTGYLDIEVFGGFNAAFGYMLSYCIKDANSDKVYGTSITPKELKNYNKLDKRVVESCVEDMKKFDRIVTYYGTKFDIPFIRTRALHHDFDFPLYGELVHNDLYYIVRHKFKCGRNSLDSAAKTLLGESSKTHLEPDTWQAANAGSQEALDYIYEHCVQDVLLTERLHDKIIGFRKRSDLSA